MNGQKLFAFAIKLMNEVKHIFIKTLQTIH